MIITAIARLICRCMTVLCGGNNDCIHTLHGKHYEGRYGLLLQLHSDQVRQFEANVMQGV